MPFIKGKESEAHGRQAVNACANLSERRDFQEGGCPTPGRELASLIDDCAFACGIEPKFDCLAATGKP